MIIGTTPTHKFTLPVDASGIKNIHIIYAQDGVPVLIKTMEDCSFDENTVSVTLTQEETFLFKYNKMAEIQIRLLSFNEDVISSSIFPIYICRSLEDEVLV